MRTRIGRVTWWKPAVDVWFIPPSKHRFSQHLKKRRNIVKCFGSDFGKKRARCVERFLGPLLCDLVPRPRRMKTNDALRCAAYCGSVKTMKEISVDDAQTQLDAVCDRALAGEVIRLRNRAGALVELTPVATGTRPARLNGDALTGYDEDAEWAAFENHCAKASD